MSEEEKKAIEEAKKQIEEVHNLNNINIFLTDSTTLKTLLNLIDRLQKELKQEKEKNKELVEEFPKILEEATKNAISKDKIKEFYKKYISESIKDFCPYDIDNSTPEKERKAGQIRILRLTEKDLLKEN